MLVLSRKPGEKIVLDNRIILTVTEVAGGKVKIGIEAPRDIPILRGELMVEPATVVEAEAVAIRPGQLAQRETIIRDSLRKLRKIPR